MSEQQKEDTQKTVVAFIVGLVIGGLMVWAFSGNGGDAPTVDKATEEDKAEITSSSTNSDKDTDDKAETPAIEKVSLPVGDGGASVKDYTAGRVVTLETATFPVAEGWVGVRDYVNDQLTGLLGVARFSESQGLVPSEIILQRPTEAGKQYAIVFYSEDGDRQFNLATDAQIDDIATTFTAK